MATYELTPNNKFGTDSINLAMYEYEEPVLYGYAKDGTAPTWKVDVDGFLAAADALREHKDTEHGRRERELDEAQERLYDEWVRLDAALGDAYVRQDDAHDAVRDAENALESAQNDAYYTDAEVGEALSARDLAYTEYVAARDAYSAFLAETEGVETDSYGRRWKRAGSVADEYRCSVEDAASCGAGCWERVY